MRNRSPPTLPIVVGGTSYYTQHLLFPGRLVSLQPSDSRTTSSAEPGIRKAPPSITFTPQELESRFPQLSKKKQEILITLFSSIQLPGSEKPVHKEDSASSSIEPKEIWDLLNELDPVMASRWHVKDTRKVRRSIAVFVETGKKHSDWIKEQEEEEALKRTSKKEMDRDECSSAEEGGTKRKRRKRNLILWVWCDPEVLKERLNNRIGKMIDVSSSLKQRSSSAYLC